MHVENVIVFRAREKEGKNVIEAFSNIYIVMTHSDHNHNIPSTHISF